MIEPRSIPEDYVNIRQVWLRQIDRCAEAISHRYMKDVHDQYSERSGLETVVESVVALETLLVDYGEAAVKTDVDRWIQENPNIKDGRQGMGRFRYHRDLFHFIVQTLNKYGMLFESQPKGFSNVEMKSV